MRAVDSVEAGQGGGLELDDLAEHGSTRAVPEPEPEPELQPETS
jgi:hypothetical protein